MVETGDAVREIPADHPARRAAARALWVCTVGALAFTTFAYLTTQVRAIRAGSPWQDNPYDGVVSFTQFLVPALAVLVAPRATLCRRRQPQPRFRINQLLRAAFVCTLLVAATTATNLLAVVFRANRPSWNDGTPWLILALVPLTEPRHLPHQVSPHDHRRPADRELFGQILEHRHRHIRRVIQERAHITHRGQLQREP